MVLSVRSETGRINSEQEFPVFAPEQDFGPRTHRKNVKVVRNTLYDVKLCVDSKSAIKNIITPRNLELSSKNRFFIFVEFEVFLTSSQGVFGQN